MLCHRHKPALLPFFPLPRGKQISKLGEVPPQTDAVGEKKSFQMLMAQKQRTAGRARGLLTPSGSPQCVQRLQRRRQLQHQLQGRLWPAWALSALTCSSPCSGLPWLQWLKKSISVENTSVRAHREGFWSLLSYPFEDLLPWFIQFLKSPFY